MGLNRILANTLSEGFNLPGLNRLKSDEFAGTKTAIKNSWDDVSKADKVTSDHNKKVKQLTKDLEAAEAAKDGSKVQQLTGQLNAEKGRLKIAQNASEQTSKALSENVVGVGRNVGSYLKAGDMKGQSGRFMTAVTRNGAIGGAYMGAAAGARYVSGGSMSTNNQGQRDIAGIPLI